jgi:hypothetical protein
MLADSYFATSKPFHIIIFPERIPRFIFRERHPWKLEPWHPVRKSTWLTSVGFRKHCWGCARDNLQEYRPECLWTPD